MAQESCPRRRTNQMERTRSAIVAAARELADSGAEVTMPAVAAAARVHEATAYRHFSDLVSLLRVALSREDLTVRLRSIADGDDPVERIGQAAEILGRAVLQREGVVRAIVASTIAKPSTAEDRPAQRFALIDLALTPWIQQNGLAGRVEVDQLVRDLAIVISAESLFTLTDLCGLSPAAAVASLAATARRTTAAAVAATTTAGRDS